MAKEKPISYARFQKQLSNNEYCRDYLLKMRWNGEYTCPKYGCKEYYSLVNRNLYQCKHCLLDSRYGYALQPFDATDMVLGDFLDCQRQTLIFSRNVVQRA